MKDSKLLGRESKNEEEKTKMELFEEEVKSSIFSVYYLLLKNQETTFWKFIVLLLIEYIQLLSFTFDESMVQSWRANGVVQYLSEFFQTFRIVYWLEKLTWDVYVIILYICIFLIFLVIIDFLYVSISFKHKRYSFMQPIQLLRIALLLIISVIYVPINEFFFTFSACGTDDTTGLLTHHIFTDEVCFQSIYILHVTMSYIMLLVFIAISFVTCMLYYENRYTKDPTAKLTSWIDIFQLISKTVYCFVFSLFYDDEYSMFKSIVLCVFSTFAFLQYITIRPYYYKSTQMLVEIFSGIFTWTNYVILFTQLIGNTMFTGALEIYLLGIPIIVVLIYTKQDSRLQLLMTGEHQLSQGQYCQMKNFFYLNIIETKEVDRYSAIVLKGYINHHSEVCPQDNCPIKGFKKMQQREKSGDGKKKGPIQNGNISGQNKAQNQSIENSALLLAQAKALYINGIKRFPQHTALRIDYANFLQSKMKDRKGALSELTQAEKSKIGFDHQFMVFRQRKIIEDELTESQEHGGMDFISAMNFENQFKIFKTLIEKSAMLHFEFWSHLLDDSPDLARLSQQGAKINASIQTVDENWKKLSKMSTNTPKALKLYASYLIEVLNDKETGNEQMMKAKEAANMRVNFEFNNMNEDYTDINNYAQDGTPCIYISGETERLGIVNQVNMSMCKIFGYTRKEDVINEDVEILMPRIYSANHKDFLNVSMQKSPDQISSRERSVFGKHFSGYIFPLWLQIKNLPSLLSGKQYVATFKVEKAGINKNIAHIIFNLNKEIMDISPSCLTMLGISYDKLAKRTILYDAASLLPQLFQGSSQIYQNKAGAHINYYFPELIEIDAKEGLRANNTNNNSGAYNNGQDGADGGQINAEGIQEGGGGLGGAGGGDENNSVNERIEEEEYDDTEMASPYRMLSTKNKQISGGYSKQSPNHINNNNDNNSAFDENRNGTGTDFPKDDENEQVLEVYNYQYRAVGSETRISQFHCNMSEIYFDLIGLSAGYHLRLEYISDFGKSKLSNNLATPLNGSPTPSGKKVKQDVFQFSYDPIYKKFIRELRDIDNKEYNLDKNYLALKQLKEQYKTPGDMDSQGVALNSEHMKQHTKFHNISYMSFLNRQQRIIARGGGSIEDYDDDEGQSEESSNASDTKQAKVVNNEAGKADLSKQTPMTPMVGQNQADYLKQIMAGEGFGKEFYKGEIERLLKFLKDKQSMGTGIATYGRLEPPKKGWEYVQGQHAGLFSGRDTDIMPKMDDDEDETAGKDGSSEKDGDQLKANIKSKKAFSTAINDRTMPTAILRLSRTAQLIMLLLIAIAITEYAVIYKQFSDTKTNFTLISESYLRTAELQKIAYFARSMDLINVKKLTYYGSDSNQTDMVQYIKSQFQTSLNTIYSIQNEINLSQLPLSTAQSNLLNSKSVNLYFLQDVNGMTALQFSLTESILQISSTIFTVSNMDLASFNETNEDVFFLLYNSFNDFYQALTLSSDLYVQELYDRSEQKNEISLVLFVVAIVTLTCSIFILIPVVQSVNSKKDKVLSLFCEIDNQWVRLLSLRCERFINNLTAEEGNDEIESEDEIDANLQGEEDDEYSLLSGPGKKVKKPKGKTQTDKMFFLKFALALMVIMAYYLASYLTEKSSVKTTQILTAELNVTAITEPFYWFALNTQREMMNNPSRPITNMDSFTVAKTSIFQLYDQQYSLQQMHLNNEAYLSADDWNQFNSLMNQDLCPIQTAFSNQTECDVFISGTLNQGLLATFVRFFETLRTNLNMYQLYKSQNNNTAITAMLNAQEENEIYIIQNYMTQPFMRELGTTLSASIQSTFNILIQQRIAIFIVFLIAVFFAFFIFWLPFLNSLNYQIYKTKLMLMIIPLEILMKIKNVAKVLQSQSLITNNTSKKKSKGGSGESMN